MKGEDSSRILETCSPSFSSAAGEIFWLYLLILGAPNSSPYAFLSFAPAGDGAGAKIRARWLDAEWAREGGRARVEDGDGGDARGAIAAIGRREINVARGGFDVVWG